MKNHYSLSDADRSNMNFAMRLSFSVGVLMLFLKTYAYYLTGSAAILSDAAESVIHVFAVGFSAYSMWLSLKPADHNHLYGHDKISFFAAGCEGAMIIIAAIFIIYESVLKIVLEFEPENLDSGMFFMAVATATNLILGFYLTRRGKKYHSIILEANGKHILTDCWTSFAVLIALILVKVTHIVVFDPLVALLAAANILWTGLKLIKRCVGGLMDQVDPEVHKIIIRVLDEETSQKQLQYHHLRHRFAGHKIFIEFHLLFPQEITLFAAHEIATEIEAKLKHSLDTESEIFSHLETQDQHDSIHQKYGLPI